MGSQQYSSDKAKDVRVKKSDDIIIRLKSNTKTQEADDRSARSSKALYYFFHGLHLGLIPRIPLSFSGVQRYSFLKSGLGQELQFLPKNWR